MASVVALEGLTDGWDLADVSEELAGAYLAAVDVTAVGPLPPALFDRLVELPFPAFRNGLVAGALKRQEAHALGCLIDLLGAGECTSEEALSWLRPVADWARLRLAERGLEHPAVRRLIGELQPDGARPPFIQVESALWVGQQKGRVTALHQRSQSVTYAPFPHPDVEVFGQVGGDKVVVYLKDREIWARYPDRKVYECLYPGCNFITADSNIIYRHLNVHHDWRPTIRSHRTPELRVQQVNWHNEMERKGKRK